MYRSLVVCEQESGVLTEPLSREMRFFRALVLDGAWDEAEQFLAQFRTRLADHHTAALFELKRQRFFEIIESKPDVEVLFRILKEIECMVAADVYKNLCFFLTLKSINDHPEYIDWSVQKVRQIQPYRPRDVWRASRRCGPS